jgi:hypothetical protein
MITITSAKQSGPYTQWAVALWSNMKNMAKYFAWKFLWINILGVTKREHKLHVSQSLWKQNAPTIINITLEAILSLLNRNLLMSSRHAKDMIN